MVDLPCPTCGSPLTFLDQYQRNYCLQCGQYAPEGYGDRGAKRCPTCGGVLSFIVQYNRFYCYRCNAYAQEEPAQPAKPETPTATPATSATETPAAPAVAAQPEAPPTPAPTETTTLVAAATPASTVLVAPASEESAPPATEPEPTPAAEPTPETAPVVAPAESPAEPESPEPSREMRTLAASKPAIVRVKIFALKKAELIDLCKAYGLDSSGTKEQVQQRLLQYLHALEAEEPPEGEPPSPVQPAAVVDEPSPAPTPAPTPVTESAPGPAVAAAAPVAAILVPPQKEEPEPAAAETVSEPAPAAEAARVVSRIEHPCPTCGRELTFIAQYDRYYCYYCQRYAPSLRAKGACPTCGASMRWIDQHQRWWCDSCQRYAPSDLPKPTNATAVATRPVAVATPMVSRHAIVLHHHASPAAGIGLVGVGLALWIIYEFFAVLAPAMSLAINNPFTNSTGAVVTFFAFVFVAAGIMVGLSSLRDRI